LTAPKCCDSIPDAVARRRYRTTRPTLALFEGEDGYIAKPIPEDACIEFDVADLLVKGANLVEVASEGRLVKMFVSDLKSLAGPE
jgi:hypothetical protein